MSGTSSNLASAPGVYKLNAAWLSAPVPVHQCGVHACTVLACSPASAHVTCALVQRMLYRELRGIEQRGRLGVAQLCKGLLASNAQHLHVGSTSRASTNSWSVSFSSTCSSSALERSRWSTELFNCFSSSSFASMASSCLVCCMISRKTQGRYRWERVSSCASTSAGLKRSVAQSNFQQMGLGTRTLQHRPADGVSF
jgi:hypothetical protein